MANKEYYLETEIEYDKYIIKLQMYDGGVRKMFSATILEKDGTSLIYVMKFQGHDVLPLIFGAVQFVEELMIENENN